MASQQLSEIDLPLLVAVGCLNVDIVATIEALPERDSRVMSNGFTKQLGGMATNVACAAAVLGHPLAVQTELIAPIGSDAESIWVQEALIDKGVSTAWLDQRTNEDTCLCMILVEATGDRAIISEPSRLKYARISERIDSTIQASTKLVHVDGFHAPGAYEYFIQARQAGWQTSLDLDELPPEHLKPQQLAKLLTAFDIVFVNRQCAKALFGELIAMAWTEQLTRLAAQTETIFLLTLGVQGVVVITADAAPTTISALKVNSVDTTGAGDVFAGVFLSAWLNGLTAVKAAEHANIAAGLSTTVYGAQGYLPDMSAIVKYL